MSEQSSHTIQIHSRPRGREQWIRGIRGIRLGAGWVLWSSCQIKVMTSLLFFPLIILLWIILRGKSTATLEPIFGPRSRIVHLIDPKRLKSYSIHLVSSIGKSKWILWEVKIYKYLGLLQVSTFRERFIYFFANFGRHIWDFFPQKKCWGKKSKFFFPELFFLGGGGDDKNSYLPDSFLRHITRKQWQRRQRLKWQQKQSARVEFSLHPPHKKNKNLKPNLPNK